MLPPFISPPRLLLSFLDIFTRRPLRFIDISLSDLQDDAATIFRRRRRAADALLIIFACRRQMTPRAYRRCAAYRRDYYCVA